MSNRRGIVEISDVIGPAERNAALAGMVIHSEQSDPLNGKTRFEVSGPMFDELCGEAAAAIPVYLIYLESTPEGGRVRKRVERAGYDSPPLPTPPPTPLRAISPEPNGRLVEYLKDMLAEAERGEIQGIVGVIIYENGDTDTVWANPPKDYHVKVNCDRVIGCIERLKMELLTSGFVKHDELFGE